MANIKYDADILSDTYSKSRICWSQFYDSEKIILERTGISKNDFILDIGCGCGGLGLALNEKFNNLNYTGIDINEPTIIKSKDVNPFGTFYCGDILDSKFDYLQLKYDKVISFSGIDWNVEFESMFQRSWNFVKPGGYLIVSLRLTDKDTVVDINKSFQQIDEHFKAQYVILNANEILETIKKLNPLKIDAYGYWKDTNKPYGNPTVSVYDKACFSVFSIHKRNNEIEPTKINLELPIKL